MGLDIFLRKNKSRAQISGVIRDTKLPFLCCHKLGLPDNTFLAYLITHENVFPAFFAFKNVLKYQFLQCFLSINQNLLKTWANKQITSQVSETHINPQLQQTVVFLSWLFKENIDVGQKAQFMIKENKDKKRDSNDKTSQETKNNRKD